MMLSFQVASMRRTINRIVASKRPASTVMILKEHAEYLGVSQVPKTESPVDSQPRVHDPNAKPYGPLYKVKVVDLYLALKDAKGVDEQELITDCGSGNQISLERETD